jgi:flagellar biosynthesis/type III secretory pathway ATPase
MGSTLDKLRRMSVVVADTGDVAAVRRSQSADCAASRPGFRRPLLPTG